MDNPIIIVIIVSVVISLLLRLLPFSIWITAKISKVDISLLDLIMMQLRKTNVVEMVRALIESKKAEIELRKDELEAHHLAGGNLDNIVHGLIYAKRNKLSLQFREASSLDLNGVNIIDHLKKKENTAHNNELC